VCHVSLPSSYRSRRGHIHLLRVLPLVGCRSKTPTKPASCLLCSFPQKKVLSPPSPHDPVFSISPSLTITVDLMQVWCMNPYVTHSKLTCMHATKQISHHTGPTTKTTHQTKMYPFILLEKSMHRPSILARITHSNQSRFKLFSPTNQTLHFSLSKS
jgi:hypothetical protein